MNEDSQCTLVLIKPDGVKRLLARQIFSRYADAGLTIAYKWEPIKATYEQLFEHYETIGRLRTRKGEKVFEETLHYMMSGALIKAIVAGPNAVEVVRKINGATKPWEAEGSTIRADFGSKDPDGPLLNVVHSSATLEEAEKEIMLWFSGDGDEEESVLRVFGVRGIDHRFYGE
ncbi:MAG: nucleoside-diphosphate kinase [candidate division SR1 bacterium]|nr:nucleoside-diphosphate kinase [candidate division SR1 bacterium]